MRGIKTDCELSFISGQKSVTGVNCLLKPYSCDTSSSSSSVCDRLNLPVSLFPLSSGLFV